MHFHLPRIIHAFEFVDTKRLACYAEFLTLDSARISLPMWDPNEPAPETPLPDPKDTASVSRLLSTVLTYLDDHGYVTTGSITASGPWPFGGVLTQEGTFRFEGMRARRVNLTPGGEKTKALWISGNSERKLFLWENFSGRDSIFDRSTYHTTADRFTQMFCRELDEMGLDWMQQFFMKDFRGDPVGALYELGAEASPAHEVTALYRLVHVCYPVTDEGDIVASFGCPIAVWPTEVQAGHEALDHDEHINRILVLFSVDDDATDRLTKAIQTSRLLRSLTFSFCYAIDRYGHRALPDADSLYEKLRGAIERMGAQALIVHYGAAFHTAPEVYQEVLKRIRGENPALLFATDAADRPGPLRLHDIQFEQTDELDEIVKLVFG
jgi:hypothetical protein